MPDVLDVYVDAAELGPSRRVGELRRIEQGAGAAVAFSYDPQWLMSPDAFTIDPSFQLFEGPQYAPEARLAGVFSDAAPDRWGRKLLERREALDARRARRRPRAQDDWDFLVGVNDSVRMGALRFQTGGTFVDGGPLAVQPVARLRELEHYAREFERGLPVEAADEQRWVAMLLAPGSSLGGTRPKANFSGEDGGLWIAKFPSRDDLHDVGAWELVVTQLALRSGIDVPDARLIRLASEYRTFAARRFDRVENSRRLYASAMTLTKGHDGADASYLDVALAISDFGDPAAINTDLEQLFRRVAFNVLVSNRDDHLRNHGFLRTPGGWRLSPAFDLNPSPGKAEHSLTLNEDIAAPDINLVIDSADYYRLTDARAREIVNQIGGVVRDWPDVARRAEIGRDEIDLMAAAFQVDAP